MNETGSGSMTRRAFVQATAAAATVGLVMPAGLYATGSDVIRVGLIGCGGRGTGAARDCMRAADGIEIVALGDLFQDRLEQCRTQLARVTSEDSGLATKYKVTPERCFVGFDAYQKVIDSGVDLVLLATPPGFRPMHLAAAVAAGKHVFAEKPVAVDAAGVRSTLATYEEARRKGLAIVVGTQRRHQAEYLATISRLHEGAIGQVLSGQVFWNQGSLWSRVQEPNWSDTEWQIRNWLYFTWLSGDHIVEQHVHNIDVANWVLGEHPIRAVGVGGRQCRVEPRFGHIYDHFAIDYEYPSGGRVLSMCRQMQGATNIIGENFIGTRGSSNAAGRIDGPNAWQFAPAERPIGAMVQEHINLIASMRAGRPLNELKQVAESTLTAIMGREAAYTGQTITWQEMLEADQNLWPPRLALGPLEVPPVAMPGRTSISRGFTG
jgi:myo-inositol 2-dehydrogenase / D-chiro-inositol 1-dehydrogenase